MKTVELIPIFDDNYVFLIYDPETSEAIVVDPGEAAAVTQVLNARKLKLIAILTTHHHADHIGGAAELSQTFAAPVWAPLKNKEQIKAAHYVSDQEILTISGCRIQVLGLPGHTLGHIAYWFPEKNWLFSGDVLFGLGCGRLFEGDFSQGFASLQKIRQLPDATEVFCAHEYTEKNLLFCKTLTYEASARLSVYENNLIKLRSARLPSVPLSLEIEKQFNPFLLAPTQEAFSVLRQKRNIF